MRMKPIIVLLTTILVCAAGPAGAIRLSEVWRQSFAVGDHPRLELENIDGDIRVEVAGEGAIEVRAEIRVKAPSKSMARDLYEGIEFVTAQEGSAASVKTVLPRVRLTGFPGIRFGEQPAIRVRYFATVPRGSALVLRTVNGDIEIAAPAGALGTVDAHAAHGRVVTR
jgi:hypothetical protein